MNNYQLLRNRIYLGGCIGIFLLGFLTARTYETDVLGASGGIAASLSDIFIGMVYDLFLIHIFPVLCHRFSCLFLIHPIKLTETVSKGRPDKRPVSYTHLDVYKRQIWYSFPQYT